MRLFELLRGADHLFEVGRHRAGGAHARKLLHLTEILACLSFGDLASALTRPEVPQRQSYMGGWLLAPIGEQLGNVAEVGLVELVEGPPGSCDDAPRDPGPINLVATGCYSPSDTGDMPEAF